MKMSKLVQIALVVGTGILLLTGCSTPAKKHGPMDSAASGGDTDMAGLPGGSDTLSPSGIPANARPAGVNPDSDVDYSVLAAETVYFDFDSSTIKASERAKLQSLADWLKQHSDKNLMLAGHADIRGTPEYNRGLGERRALAVREYLVGLDIEAGRLFTISYGSERPADSGTNESAYSKNRRVAAGVITK